MVCGVEVKVLDETAVLIPSNVRATGIVGASHYLFTAERYPVQHGRCERHRLRWGRYFGLLAGTAMIVTMVWLAANVLVHNGRFGAVEIGLCAAFVASFAAMIWCMFHDLGVAKTDGKHLWITGFGRGYLAALPRFESAPAGPSGSV